MALSGLRMLMLTRANARPQPPPSAARHLFDPQPRGPRQPQRPPEVAAPRQSCLETAVAACLQSGRGSAARRRRVRHRRGCGCAGQSQSRCGAAVYARL